MMVEMTTDYNETEWVNQWTGATIPPPNNQESFEINLEFQLEFAARDSWAEISREWVLPSSNYTLISFPG